MLINIVISSHLYAGLSDKHLSCPSLDWVRENAEKVGGSQPDADGTYNVYSGSFVDGDNKSWVIIVNYILAKSNNEAVILGQEMVKTITVQFNQYPYKLGNMQFCGYDNQVLLIGGMFDSINNISELLSYGKQN